jgi:hypothetical protein
MYIIMLDPERGLMYQGIYDEGFTSTTQTERATKFMNQKEATEILQTQGVQQLYAKASVERIKQ